MTGQKKIIMFQSVHALVLSNKWSSIPNLNSKQKQNILKSFQGYTTAVEAENWLWSTHSTTTTTTDSKQQQKAVKSPLLPSHSRYFNSSSSSISIRIVTGKPACRWILLWCRHSWWGAFQISTPSPWRFWHILRGWFGQCKTFWRLWLQPWWPLSPFKASEEKKNISKSFTRLHSMLKLLGTIHLRESF